MTRAKAIFHKGGWCVGERIAVLKVTAEQDSALASICTESRVVARGQTRVAVEYKLPSRKKFVQTAIKVGIDPSHLIFAGT